MQRAAKIILVDDNDHHLLLYRSNHPLLGDDADIPGGVVEDGETAEIAVIRELYEETGLRIDTVEQVYSGLEYSKHGVHKTLFRAHVNERPKIVINWEHSSYEWLPKESFLEKAKNANDTYMHMVYEVLK
ncbi:MAG: NUDIX hydrolase [Candidatus Microsaccharimonas sp.]